jgi:hypothetical protein
VIEDSLALPPLDLTLPAASYANLSVYVLIAVDRNSFAGLASQAPPVTLGPALPQTLINRQSLLPLPVSTPPQTPAPNAVWATAIGTQTYGYYLLRRSEPVFVDFTTPTPVPPTTTTAAPATTPAATTTPAPTTTLKT